MSIRKVNGMRKKIFFVMLILFIIFVASISLASVKPWFGLNRQKTPPKPPANGIKLFCDSNDNLSVIDPKGNVTILGLSVFQSNLDVTNKNKSQGFLKLYEKEEYGNNWVTISSYPSVEKNCSIFLPNTPGIAITNTTLCNNIEGNGLSIDSNHVLNWSASSTDLTDGADIAHKRLDVILDTDTEIALKQLDCLGTTRINACNNPITYNLPSASTGLSITLCDFMGEVITINSKNAIYLTDGTVAISIKSSGEKCSFIKLVAITPTLWIVLNCRGVWTKL